MGLSDYSKVCFCLISERKQTKSFYLIVIYHQKLIKEMQTVIWDCTVCLDLTKKNYCM